MIGGSDYQCVGRLAVIGDVGGHAHQLHLALVDLGMDLASFTLPDDLTVVQVGDLIHTGPASGEVLTMVRHIINHQPRQWVQLVGGHESLYLPGAPGEPGSESLSSAGQRLLADWWSTGRMRVAAGVSTEYGELLVTHAGLTAGVWQAIGAPSDVRQAVQTLNALPEVDPGLLWRAGQAARGGEPDLFAGPVWADAGLEVYPSWLAVDAAGRQAPFGQVHGHSSAFDFNSRSWRCAPGVRGRLLPVRRRRHLAGVIAGRLFAGVDPGFDRSVRGPWTPLVFDSARVLAR